MRIGGRTAAAIEVLAEMTQRHRPAADALRDWGSAHRFAGSGDRNAIGNLVFDSLRRRASQSWRMDSDTPASLVIATLVGQWEIEPENLALQFTDDRFAPKFDPGKDLTAWRSRELHDAPGHVQADIPEWCKSALQRQFGEGWIAEAAALATRPPLDLRVNTLKSSRDKVLRQLDRMGAKPCEFAPNGVRIDAPVRDGRLPNVTASNAYGKGWIEIQDEGSQLAGLMTGANAGEQVLDYCAGAGGKTLALSAQMENRGQVHAHDKDAGRLAKIHERLRRAGTRNIQVHGPGGDLNPLHANMDRVLVDAPCSGSGTWRRRPDAKWRLTPETLALRMGEQDEIFAAAKDFVRPGGMLIYVTCSLFPEENMDTVDRFLEKHPQWRTVSVEPQWRHLCENSHIRSLEQDNMLLTPATTKTDGFFIARLSRNSFDNV